MALFMMSSKSPDLNDVIFGTKYMEFSTTLGLLELLKHTHIHTCGIISKLETAYGTVLGVWHTDATILGLHMEKMKRFKAMPPEWKGSYIRVEWNFVERLVIPKLKLSWETDCSMECIRP